MKDTQQLAYTEKGRRIYSKSLVAERGMEDTQQTASVEDRRGGYTTFSLYWREDDEGTTTGNYLR